MAARTVLIITPIAKADVIVSLDALVDRSEEEGDSFVATLTASRSARALTPISRESRRKQKSVVVDSNKGGSRGNPGPVLFVVESEAY